MIRFSFTERDSSVTSAGHGSLCYMAGHEKRERFCGGGM